jgi:hypothetical protein
MKFFAIEITPETLPLVTALNDGIEPAPESMNNIFMYPATKPEENYSTIITREEFRTVTIVEQAISICIVTMK